MEDNKENEIIDNTQVINVDEVNEALARAEAEKENGGELRQRRAAASIEEESDEETEVMKEVIEEPVSNITEEKNVIKEDKKESNEKKVKEPKAKKNGKKINVRLVCFIVILIALVIITISLVFLKLKSINNKYTYVEENTNVFEQKETKEDESLKYVIGMDERYNTNDLAYKTIRFMNNQRFDGEVGAENYNNKFDEIIEIDGLLNKDVQNKINQDLMSYRVDDHSVFERVIGSYSNILSVEIRISTTKDQHGNLMYDYYGANYDLNTGEKITLKDLFTDSAPIISILTEGFTKALSWRLDYQSGQEVMMFEKDLNNADTSEFEDAVFKVKKSYEALGDNIQFSFDENKIYVYNLMKEEMDGVYFTRITIEIYPYNQYFTAYKKYVKSGVSIYENKYNKPRSVVPYMSLKTTNEYYDIQYKEGSNYIVHTINNTYKEDEMYKYLSKEKIASVYNDEINKYVQMANSDPNNFYVIQTTSYRTINDENSDFIRYGHIYYVELSLHINVTKFPINQKNRLPELFAEVYNTPGASIEGEMMTSLEYKKNRSDLAGFTYEIKPATNYFDLNGNYLGDSEECTWDDSSRQIYYGS